MAKANNKQTSSRVATKAAKELRTAKNKDEKSVAGSDLVQTKPKPKKAPKKK